MIVMLDINVLFDVFLFRQPHYPSSSRVLSCVASGNPRGVFAAHGLTTLYYLARKEADKATAEAAVDRILAHFQIANLDAAGWRQARTLALPDCEDAVIACSAASHSCDFIITRNRQHFVGSPVPAITPTDFLCMFTP
jgi:hypothetical protein